ncbi:unnamed protein product [Oncorhynchus mykiss]|uniref:SH2 domain-containing protein n=1 Tax=Oncorhynchus mykiss TaxID=8022 RepID=A0A060WNQ1_ONCMY|nr:unnamed protein product [Oncorhynchus mykiss]
MSISSLIERSEEKKGSFFKLIDSFVWEIRTLKKEMVQKAEQAEGDPEPVILQGLDGQVGGLFLPPCVGVRAGLAGVRDSGNDSLRRMSVLDRLVQTHAVWLQLGLSRAEATRKLQPQPTGTFLVRKSTTLRRKVISLRMHQDSETPVKDFPVKECQCSKHMAYQFLSIRDLYHPNVSPIDLLLL